MKMIKLTEKHYILVDDKFDPIDSDRKYVHKSGRIWQWDSGMAYVSNNPPQPITHSTQPEFLGTGWMQSVQPLLLSEIKELLGEVDIEKKVVELYNNFKLKPFEAIYPLEGATKRFVENVYNQAIEDNKEKKYTEEDMRKAMVLYSAWITGGAPSLRVAETAEQRIEQIIQSLQPKTEWEVEFVDEKLRLK